MTLSIYRNLLSVVSYTVLPLSSKWNWRSVCMTPHYILQRKRRWNEMKWDPAGTSTHNTTASASVALSHRERLTERLSMFPICETLSVPGYWLVWAAMFLHEHQLGMSGTGEPEFCFCAPCIYSSFIWIPPLPLSFYLLYLIPPSPPQTVLSPLHLSSQRPLPLWPQHLSFLLSLYLLPSWVDSVEGWWIRLHVTVWHESESDVVNMVAADSPVEIVHTEGALRHGYTLA